MCDEQANALLVCKMRGALEYRAETIFTTKIESGSRDATAQVILMLCSDARWIEPCDPLRYEAATFSR
jgi:hypothetical protein